MNTLVQNCVCVCVCTKYDISKLKRNAVYLLDSMQIERACVSWCCFANISKWLWIHSTHIVYSGFEREQRMKTKNIGVCVGCSLIERPIDCDRHSKQQQKRCPFSSRSWFFFRLIFRRSDFSVYAKIETAYHVRDEFDWDDDTALDL